MIFITTFMDIMKNSESVIYSKCMDIGTNSSWYGLLTCILREVTFGNLLKKLKIKAGKLQLFIFETALVLCSSLSLCWKRDFSRIPSQLT